MHRVCDVGLPEDVDVPAVPVPGISNLPAVPDEVTPPALPPFPQPSPGLPSAPPLPAIEEVPVSPRAVCALIPRSLPNGGPLLRSILEGVGLDAGADDVSEIARDVAAPRERCDRLMIG